jgi:signal transduction histidine kinase
MALVAISNPDKSAYSHWLYLFLVALLVVAYEASLYLLLDRPFKRVIAQLSLAADTILTVAIAGMAGGVDGPLALFALFPVLESAAQFRRDLTFAVIAFISVAYTLLGLTEVLSASTTFDVFQAGINNCLVVLLGSAIAASGWWREESTGRDIERAMGRARQVREGAKAFLQIADTLSTTLNYERVLEGILDAGMKAFEGPGGEQHDPVGLILLFTGEDGLSVAASRNLKNGEGQRFIPGAEGVIGRALSSAEPIVVADPVKDPELGQFASLGGRRSAIALPLRAGFRVYGVLVFASKSSLSLADERTDLLNALSKQAVVALQNSQLYLELQEERGKLMASEDELRRQLARDLHDGPTQGIAAVALRMAYIRTLLDRDPEQVKEELESAERLAYDTSKEMRATLFKLRPVVLENEGLAAALKQYTERLQELDQTSFWLDAGGFSDRLDPLVESTIFAIVEEAVGNARKHSEAENIWIELKRSDRLLLVGVRDDGVGFDVDNVKASYHQRASLGLLNMQERASLIDATFDISSAPGEGTAVSLTVPLPMEPV